jgi:UDPglucose 6-dehydrogenase
MKVFVVVNKSTVLIDSGNWVQRIIMDAIAERPDVVTANFDVVSNPEFLREGSAIYATVNPDRIVLGSNSDRAICHRQELYAPIINRQFAEGVNLAPRSPRAVRI